MTHETSVRRPRSTAIVGSAVARIVWSSTAGSIARTIAANGRATAGGAGRGGGGGCERIVGLHGERGISRTRNVRSLILRSQAILLRWGYAPPPRCPAD